MTDVTVVTKYGVLPTQYADFATLRGDSSDGLPGVAGIGEKTAATLLAAHGDLHGIIAAAEAGEGMSAGIRSKILAGLPYLAVAPTVVEVVKDLDLAESDSRLRALDDAGTGGCRSPRRAMGAGHGDDAHHRRARRRRQPLTTHDRRILPAEYVGASRGQTKRPDTAAYDRAHAGSLPSAHGGESGPRFQPPPGVTLFVPVVLALLIQVPGTIGISVWQHIPFRYRRAEHGAGRGIRPRAAGRSAVARPTVAVVAALTLADLFVPPDASPPFIALAFAIIGAVVRSARLWALISVGARVARRRSLRSGCIDTNMHPFRVAITTVGLAACFAIGEGTPPAASTAAPSGARSWSGAAPHHRARRAHTHRP